MSLTSLPHIVNFPLFSIKPKYFKSLKYIDPWQYQQKYWIMRRKLYCAHFSICERSCFGLSHFSSRCTYVRTFYYYFSSPYGFTTYTSSRSDSISIQHMRTEQHQTTEPRSNHYLTISCSTIKDAIIFWVFLRNWLTLMVINFIAIQLASLLFKYKYAYYWIYCHNFRIRSHSGTAMLGQLATEQEQAPRTLSPCKNKFNIEEDTWSSYQILSW